jgi:hypothetical protein
MFEECSMEPRIEKILYYVPLKLESNLVSNFLAAATLRTAFIKSSWMIYSRSSLIANMPRE